MEKVLIRMPQPLKEWLKKEADRMGLTMNALLLKILWEAAKGERDNAKS